MTIHATLSKTTDGRVSTWNFCELDGMFFALRGNNKIIACKDIDDMRRLYRAYRDKYGFTKVSAQPATAAA